MGYDKYPNDDGALISFKKMDFDKVLMEKDFFNNEKYQINIDDTGEVKVVNKPIKFSYDENDMDKNLRNKESIDSLNFHGLKLPSEYKDKSL